MILTRDDLEKAFPEEFLVGEKIGLSYGTIEGVGDVCRLHREGRAVRCIIPYGVDKDRAVRICTLGMSIIFSERS